MARFNIDSNIGDFLNQFRNLQTLFTEFPGRIRGGIRSLRTFRVALISTGVGAIAVALGTLIAAFREFQPVVDAVNVVMAQLGALFQSVLREIREFITGVEESNLSIRESIQLAGDLERAQQALADREIELITIQAMRRVELSRLRLAAADQTLSEEQRAQALRDALVVQNDIFDTEREIASERVRILEEQSRLQTNSREENRALAQAQAALIPVSYTHLTLPTTPYV